MKSLNYLAIKIFLRLIEAAKNTSENYTKIRNNDSFMPVSVELVAKIQAGEIWSIGHYGVQNGDAMADPVMDFLVTPSNFIYPISFKNDYMGSYSEALFFEDGKPSKYCFKTYADLKEFAEMWLRNIMEQQEIKAL